MFVDDLANAIFKVMKLSKKKYRKILKLNGVTFLNIGTSKALSIKELALKIKKEFKYKGDILFNKNFPNGNPYKVLNCKIIFKIWKPKISLKKGIRLTIEDYKKNIKLLRN